MQNYRLLLITTCIISGCSICYELLISAVSAYLLGDALLQYSITIGLYMSAMGLGSYISKFIKANLFNWFIAVEIAVGIFGGLSAVILFFANIYLLSYHFIMYTIVIFIGILVGLEIPLLTRLIENGQQNLRITLSSLFAFDYLGGLVGAVAFPLLLVPQLGYIATALLCGVLNLCAASAVLWKYKTSITNYRFHISFVGVLTIAMLVGGLYSGQISNFVESALYRDQIIYREQTPYQHIVMTRHRDDLRLFIDGNLQFSSSDEYRYHEALVHVPMAQALQKKNILILGGGDGLAARELLKYPIEHITIVDLDKAMTDLAQSHPLVTDLNKGSMKNPKVTIINDDALKFLERNTQQYDLIIVDLPDPNNEAMSKLYSNVFYRLCYNALSETGILTVQSTSPYYATNTYWCINKTIASEGFYVKPYHLQVPSFGDWGFNMASKQPLGELKELEPIETHYLNAEIYHRLFQFAKDEQPSDINQIEVNTITKPIIIEYYQKAVGDWR